MAEGADCKEEKGAGGGEDEGNGKADRSKRQQKKKEDGAAGKKKAAPVVLGVDLHCDGCARKVVKAVKAAQGVEGVAADVAAGTVTVSGKAVDLWDLKDRVEARTDKPVAFVSPPNPPKKKKDGGDTAEGNKCPAADGKGAKTAGDDKKNNNKEAPESTVVVKIGLHCNGCIDRIRRTAHKIKGSLVSFPLLQYQEEERRRLGASVLSPATPLVQSASGGPVGCGGAVDHGLSPAGGFSSYVI